MSYIIVEADSISYLVEKVNKFKKDGYLPLGGMIPVIEKAFDDEGEIEFNTIYTQTMDKEETF